MHKLTSLFSLGRLALVLLILTLFAGCSDDKSGSDSTWNSCQTCHYGGRSGPDLTPPDQMKNLWGKKFGDFNWDDIDTTNSQCEPNNEYISQKGEVEKSSILSIISDYNHNLANDNGKDCGAYNYHSTVNAVLNAEERNNLIQWIKDNGTGTP